MRKILFFVLGILVILIVAVAAALLLIYSGVYDVAASSGHYAAVGWVLDTVKVHSIRYHSPKTVDLSGASTEEGLHHYHEMCAVCHGAPGRPRSAIGEGLLPQPPEMHEIVEEFSPPEIHWVVTHGLKMTGMPGFGMSHSDQDLKNIIAAVLQRIVVMSADEYATAVQNADSGHHP